MRRRKDEGVRKNEEGGFMDGKLKTYTPTIQEIETNEKNFTYHAPKDDQPSRYVFLRDRAKELADIIIQACPPSRERSLALTKLEECTFWMNASISRNE
jgi:hypothetical protein